MTPKIHPSLIDVIIPEDGYPEHLQLQDTREALMQAVSDAGAAITEFPDNLWIERKDWDEVAREQERTKTRPIDYQDRFTNQNPTHECTCHSLVAVCEAAWNRQTRIPIGPPVKGERLPASAKSKSVWFSPLSVYSEANPRQWGGAGVRQVLNIAARRGMLPDTIQPREYGFKHTLHGTTGGGGVNQSKGPWVSVSKFPTGWEGTAIHFRPKEFIFPDSVEQTVCLVLNGYAVGVGRKGHAIPYSFWAYGQNLMGYKDSYDIIRYDSLSTISQTVGGAFSVISMITPDDYDKPAG